MTTVSQCYHYYLNAFQQCHDKEYVFLWLQRQHSGCTLPQSITAAVWAGRSPSFRSTLYSQLVDHWLQVSYQLSSLHHSRYFIFIWLWPWLHRHYKHHHCQHVAITITDHHHGNHCHVLLALTGNTARPKLIQPKLHWYICIHPNSFKIRHFFLVPNFATLHWIQPNCDQCMGGQLRFFLQ